jgi:hypothetical protein
VAQDAGVIPQMSRTSKATQVLVVIKGFDDSPRKVQEENNEDLRDVVKLGSVAGLYLDPLGHFSAGIDPVALESAEDGIEATLFDPEPASQVLNHLPICMRIFQMHVKRGRIGCADPLKSSLATPEFHAAFEVRVKNPHVILSPKALD